MKNAAMNHGPILKNYLTNKSEQKKHHGAHHQNNLHTNMQSHKVNNSVFVYFFLNQLKKYCSNSNVNLDTGKFRGNSIIINKVIYSVWYKFILAQPNII